MSFENLDTHQINSYQHVLAFSSLKHPRNFFQPLLVNNVTGGELANAVPILLFTTFALTESVPKFRIL